MPDTLSQEPPLNAIYYHDWENAHIPEILEEIYLKEIYKPFLIGKTNLTIIDAGSNIGLSAMYFSKYAKRVICLEPSEMHREACEKMITQNKLRNITILPYGLSNENGKRRFYLQTNNTAFSLTRLEPQAKEIEVEAIDINTLFKIGKIEGVVDIFKCDVEGEEAKVFTSESFKKNTDRFPVILGEYHTWCGVSQAQFMNMFRDYGYQFNWIPGTKAAVFNAVKIW